MFIGIMTLRGKEELFANDSYLMLVLNEYKHLTYDSFTNDTKNMISH